MEKLLECSKLENVYTMKNGVRGSDGQTYASPVLLGT